MITPDEHERFMRLFLQYEPELLRAVLVFIPQTADARDILQETAVALWKHFHKYDASRPFINWACGYARIEVRRFLRQAQRRALMSVQAADALLVRVDRQTAEAAERERHLADCRVQLAPEMRRVLDGYYLEEQSVVTLADRHGRSPEAIYKMLQRIRRVLFDCMERKMTEAKQ
jgi:RNA polymerase sigma-70 factor (ECF subfamily)